jgi:glyoxylase-like metal-dependent hydrolase (beta-lactamase superfamily II)
MPIPWHALAPGYGLRKLCVGPLENNVYVVVDRASGRCVVIDAAAEPDRIAAAVADLTPVAILTTHGHHAHVGAAVELRDSLAVPWRIHAGDAPLAGIDPDQPLADHEEIELGAATLTCVHTPGHTPGSMSFAMADRVFTGDALFPGGPGATAGPEAFATAMDSLRDRLFTLDDETVFHPGHGLDSTIGTERPSLPDWAARGW